MNQIKYNSHVISFSEDLSSGDNLCRPRLGPTKCRALSGFKLFDAKMAFLEKQILYGDIQQKSMQRIN